MLSLYVNLFAACAYFAKMASHVSGDNLDDAPYSLVMYTYVSAPLFSFFLPCRACLHLEEGASLMIGAERWRH
jgi:hypothetical protein